MANSCKAKLLSDHYNTFINPFLRFCPNLAILLRSFLNELQLRIESLKPEKYKITIDADSIVASKEIPAKYKNVEETPIVIEVSTGRNVFDFELAK